MLHWGPQKLSAEGNGDCGGVSPPQSTRGLWERRELPQRGSGRSPGQKRILAFSEGHRTLIFVYYMTKSAGDNLHYRSLLQILGGACSPVPPWSTPMFRQFTPKRLSGPVQVAPSCEWINNVTTRPTIQSLHSVVGYYDRCSMSDMPRRLCRPRKISCLSVSEDASRYIMLFSWTRFSKFALAEMTFR